MTTIRKSSCIIAVSEYLERIIKKEINVDATRVIPCGFSEEYFYPLDKKEMRIELQLSPDQKILLFAGNLIHIKGVDMLIKVLKILQDKKCNYKLFIIGNGTERKALEEQSYNCGMQDEISFLGRKSQKDVALYMNASDVVVVPSRDEGRSLVILEALACGRPVVAFDTGGIPETITNDKLGILIPKGDLDSFAKGIIKALEYEWDSKYQSDYAGKYSNSQTASDVFKVYEEVIRAQRKGRTALV